MLSSLRGAGVAAGVLTLALVAFLLAFVGLAVFGCTPLPQPPPTYDASTCAAACSKARELCGPEALKPRTGQCEDVCRTTEEGGGSFSTGCLASQTTCHGILVCSR